MLVALEYLAYILTAYWLLGFLGRLLANSLGFRIPSPPNRLTARSLAALVRHEARTDPTILTILALSLGLLGVKYYSGFEPRMASLSFEFIAAFCLLSFAVEFRLRPIEGADRNPDDSPA